MADDPNTLMLFLRLALSFGMVLGLVGGITWVLRRKGLLRPTAGAGAGGRLEVLDRKSVGKNASLVLARVGDTAVLLGVSGDRIQVVSDRPGLDAAWRDADSTTALAEVTELAEQVQPVAATASAPAATRPSARPALTLATAPTTATAPMTTRTGGARRTGLPMAAPAAGRTRMSFIEALQELTVRRS
jgi:flagellar biogenesis protein FliO